LPTATTSTFPLVTAPTLPSPPPTQYLYPSTTNTNPTIYLPIYSKEVATIAKIYIDSQKYNRVSNSFNFKLTIFYNICKRASLPPKGYITAFLTILKGLT
jgi:hypothetical protein